MTINPEIDTLNQRIAELEAELEQAKSGIHPAKNPVPFLSGIPQERLELLANAFEENEPDLSMGSCVPPDEQVGELPYCGDPNCPDCQDKQMEKAGLKWNIVERKPPLFCDKGKWIVQNITSGLKLNYRVDLDLPDGTIEYWDNGKLIGRIENIGIV